MSTNTYSIIKQVLCSSRPTSLLCDSPSLFDISQASQLPATQCVVIAQEQGCPVELCVPTFPRDALSTGTAPACSEPGACY